MHDKGLTSKTQIRVGTAAGILFAGPPEIFENHNSERAARAQAGPLAGGAQAGHGVERPHEIRLPIVIHDADGDATSGHGYLSCHGASDVDADCCRH